jgi:ribosomal-protein-alanine N-acetyltransferase
MNEIDYSKSSIHSESIPEVPQLSSKRLHYNNVLKSDALELFQIAGDEETVRWVSWPQHKSIQETENFIQSIEQSLNIHSKEAFITWALREKNSAHNLLGLVHYSQFGEIAAQIDFVIGRKHWGQGFAAESVVTICNWAFLKNPKLRRIQCHCVAEHSASRKVLEKAGFTFEGFRREGLELKGQVYNMAIYSILRNESYTE